MIAVIEIDCDIFLYISILFLPNVFYFDSHNGLVLVHDRTFKTEQ